MNSNTAILFGGAKGYSSKYEIKNDVYVFKIKENTWIKLNPIGDIPPARAAHAACALKDNHLAIFGGTCLQGELASDDLYVLELSSEKNSSIWYKVPNDGNGPGKRYGHTLIYYEKYLLIFGGNLGNALTNKVHFTIINDNNDFTKPIKWEVLKTKENTPSPPPRIYHACNICKYGGAANMIIVFGGRDDKGNPLNDCWGLRKHRNNTWDWVSAPYDEGYEPQKRFQHTITFFYNFLIVVGGRNSPDVKQIPIEIYDTSTSKWVSTANFNKFRHTAWIKENFIYIHGGFQLTNSLVAQSDIIKIDLSRLFTSNETLKEKYTLLEKKITEDREKEKEREKIKKESDSKNVTPTISPEAGVRSKYEGRQRLKISQETQENIKEQNKLPMSDINEKPLIQKVGEISLTSGGKEEKLVIKPVSFDDKGNIKSISIKNNKDKKLCDIFIEKLLKPDAWLKEKNENLGKGFCFDIDKIASLTKQCMEIVSKQPNILKVSAPVKVFGDIHGQYIDLMNFFNKWGSPSEGQNGDIMTNDYLFLGDFVDRGNLSLETICLLMALKVKYPDQIHLLRGNHEDILINSGFGFQSECQARLKDESENDDSLFALINNFFEYLPFAAVIEDQILCVHGGIGATLTKLSDIETIKRPFEVVHEAQTREEKFAMDLLWSDPTDNDEELGIQPNYQRDSNNLGYIVRYGPDIVKKFLKDNNLSYIIRAHECVLDGFERFAGGSLITVFSATDYCGRHKNAGAMIVINQHMQMIPHLIYPPDGGNNNWIEDEEYYKKRPPTPPRVRYDKTNY